MGLIRNSFKRRSGYRDAKLIVIATEGNNTEPAYFEGLAGKYRRPSVHIEVLKRTSTNSSPAHILRELDEFRRKYNLVLSDELWMVIDKDRWPQQQLGLVAQACVHKNYFFAVSVPCFELWLLLHIENPGRDDVSNLTCDQIGARIRQILGSYNKGNPDIETFLPHVLSAIDRARCLDTQPEDRWPQSVGSRVYLLAEKIVQ